MNDKIIFVADLFSEDYAGGAELTTEALISKNPINTVKILSRNLNMQIMQQYADCVWVFGNFASLDFNLIPAIATNLRYVILEYDYKFCKYRSVEKHLIETGSQCDCHDREIGKLVSAFYYASDHIFWMSLEQRSRYLERFPFLSDKKTTVLSSVFSDNFFEKISSINSDKRKRDGWIVLGSKSWIKGADDAESWCKENGKKYEIVWDIPYEKMLDKFSIAEGFVYLPKGGDTCPRMVIEAKLLGCSIVTNSNVQHATEEWFQSAPDDICSYLKGRPDVFWGEVIRINQNQPSISGYTTTLDCIKHRYPFEESIRSMIGFCDEVVIVDGGSTDGTWEVLQNWAQNEKKLKIVQNKRDWSHKRFAVFDGDQKAVARSYCTGDFCWQMDADEVLPAADWEKVRNICKNFPKNTNLICLPVVEYWGSKEKVRMDITPWKWRLSRNLPHITHGIPASLRRVDENGDTFAQQGTDGCDYINSKTGEHISAANFYTEEAHRARIAALNGHVEARHAFQEWFKNAISVLPSPRHFSWFDIERKIRTYRDYWQKHWESLYDIKQEDTPENNMFFDKSWKDVSDDEITNLSSRLSREMGGWIFHRKIDWNQKTPYMTISENE
jgi:glycosyltransferase involved in cell wall biosynthesis